MGLVGNDGIRIKYLLYCLTHRDGFQHAKFLKSHNAFAEMGEGCFFQPYNLPQDAKAIKMGDNVVVASNVMFISHDVIHYVFNNENASGGTDSRKFIGYHGIITIDSNVFIGANTTILPNVHIAQNVIVAAGSIVTKDLPSGTVCGGVPARVIGDYAELREQRQKWSAKYKGISKCDLMDILFAEK